MGSDPFDRFISDFAGLLRSTSEFDDIRESGRGMMSDLVAAHGWFDSTLSRLVLDRTFLDSQWQSVDPNAIDLYIAPDKSFLVRAFVWEPGVVYPIHDHGAWGITGCLIGQIGETKYQRRDDGSDPDHAEIEEVSSGVLARGRTGYVLPLSIHRMEALNGEVAVSVHAYGPVMRKGFIHFFYPQSGTASRVYGPSINKKILAIRTLGVIREPWSEQTLETVLQSHDRDYVLREAKHSLEKLHER